MIDEARILALNHKPPRRGDYVLYWMQAAQRCSYNHALSLAILEANGRNLPVVVFFGLTPRFPAANARHYAFMLEGLAVVARELAERGIAFCVRQGDPVTSLASVAARASLVVVDEGYLRVQRQWYERAARTLDCSLVQVETNVVVPVRLASKKEEWAARTLRPKIDRLFARFLVSHLVPEARVSRDIDLDTMSLADPSVVLASLDIDRTVAPSRHYRGGYTEARRRLEAFIENGLPRYAREHNDPAAQASSGLSAYLHFGQISPLEVALAARQADPSGSEPFLEELIVRRELAANMAFYCPVYDSYACVPAWARRTLEQHAADSRPELYTAAELDQGLTDDIYWNAAQREMVATGSMAGYMRMYWGKRIMQWTSRPEEAYAIAAAMNDRYQLDGRDPNGYAGIAWCFGKHDRPWGERPVMGTVRTMTAAGLERKFDMSRYVRYVAMLD